MSVEKIRLMRTVGWHAEQSGEQLALLTYDTFRQCSVPDKQIDKIMGRTVTAAMCRPWTILVHRDRQWQLWQAMKWHPLVPCKHAQAPLEHSDLHVCRVMLLVVTTNPQPAVLVATQQATQAHGMAQLEMIPCDDLIGSKCTEPMLQMAQQWCDTLGIETVVFTAGTDKHESHTTVAAMAPIPDIAALQGQLWSSAAHMQWLTPRHLSTPEIKFAATLAVNRMQMFAGPS